MQINFILGETKIGSQIFIVLESDFVMNAKQKKGAKMNMGVREICDGSNFFTLKNMPGSLDCPLDTEI